MIQYSSINDAWGNYKKNTLDNYVQNKVENKIEPQIENFKPNIENIINPEPKIDIIKNIENIENKILNSEPKLDTKKEVLDHHILEMNDIDKFETFEKFENCSFAEHLGNCKKCRDKLGEYFTNGEETVYSEINLFGLHIKITKDVLKVIFIILLILILVLTVSTINMSFKNTEMKYYMMQPPNMYRPYY
jgi:hypothetical protein